LKTVSGALSRHVEAKVQIISALLHEVGKKPRQIVVDLDALHSPKPSISQSDLRYLRALKGMATAQSRAKMPPIDLQPLGVKRQKKTVPLSQVALDP
jgi:hypothetical protein